MSQVTGIHKTRLYALALFLTALTAALASSAVSSAPPPEPSPPTEITLGAEDQGRTVQLHQGEELVISLEAIPSTGYGWQVDQGLAAAQSQPILVQTGESFDAQGVQTSTDDELSVTTAPLLGAPEIQTLRFQAAQAGETTLRLVYRRPWEEDVPPAQEFSLSVEAIGPFTQPPTPLASSPQATSQVSADLSAAEQLGLLSAFNWCDLGDCTPVKDQDGCGSCWAFATVGPLESNILIHDGLEKDLSEQYLLSCNTDGYDCSGGNFAHDYHEWKYWEDHEPGPGAVYETDFPYVGWEAPCNPPHTHHEKIVEWEYIGSGIPPVANIKKAILDHGPVSVAICSAGSAFHSYKGGVYDTSECTKVDHAVVLVGWDDSQGSHGIWYLRNSWGKYWGEGGYMRIGYGVNSVGYAANYIVYPSCYTLETQVYPADTGTVVADTPPNCGDAYEPDTVVELTAEADPGWHFFSWGGDASGSDNPTSITMDSDKSVTAFMMCDGCTRRHIYPLGMRRYQQD
jgi:inhibitor of cysteine peptidase